MGKTEAKSMEILETDDYSRFKFIEGNRPISAANVAKLKQSLQRNGWIEFEPAKVTEDMMVVDGQHRIVAARTLGIPVKYTIVDVTGRLMGILSDIQQGKQWAGSDHIRMLALTKNTNAQWLWSLFTEYSRLALPREKLSETTVTTLFMKRVNGGKIRYRQSEAIKWLIAHSDNEIPFELIKEIIEDCKFHRACLRALNEGGAKIARAEAIATGIEFAISCGCDKKKLIKAFETRGYMLHGARREDIIKSIDEIYNYGAKTKINIVSEYAKR